MVTEPECRSMKWTVFGYGYKHYSRNFTIFDKESTGTLPFLCLKDDN